MCLRGGHLSKKLEEEGFKVFSSDIIKRDFECKEVDFLNYDKTELNVNILTNPPYKFAKEFAEKALEVIKDGKLIFLFLRIQFLESQKRRPLFEKKQLKYMLVYSKRTPQCARNGDFSKPSRNATTYCWFIWEKGWTGDPIIKWI